MKKNLLLSAALLFGIILSGNNVFVASEDAPTLSSTAIKSSNSSHLDYLTSTVNTVRRNYQRANPQYNGELTIMTRDQYREYLKDGGMREAPSLNDTVKN